MSLGYVIKDGMVVGTEFCFSSHRTWGGAVVKPNTYEQEERLKRSLELTGRMQELQQELQEKQAHWKQRTACIAELSKAHLSQQLAEEMDCLLEELNQTEHTVFAPDQVNGLLARWGTLQQQGDSYAAQAAVLGSGYGLLEQIRQKQLSCMADRQNGLLQITAMEKELDELETLYFTMETTEGTAQLPAQVNERTGRQVEKIRDRLKELDAELQQDPYRLADTEKLLKKLEDIKEEIAALEPKAKEVFNTQIWRQQQAMAVIERLQQADSGWNVTEVRQGDGLFDDTCLILESEKKNSMGSLYKALVSFCLDGEIRIDSFFQEDALGTRGKLQQLVLGTLQAGGATGAVGTCTDGENVSYGQELASAVGGQNQPLETQQSMEMVQPRQEKESKQRSKSIL